MTADPSPTSRPAALSRRMMRRAFVADDHVRALAEADALFATGPADEEPTSIAARCRESVEAVLLAVFGGAPAQIWIEAWGSSFAPRRPTAAPPS